MLNKRDWPAQRRGDGGGGARAGDDAVAAPVDSSSRSTAGCGRSRATR